MQTNIKIKTSLSIGSQDKVILNNARVTVCVPVGMCVQIMELPSVMPLVC